jgi:catechol 2,3-dioxygenase
MGVTSQDIFGQSSGAVPADEGTYGEAPKGHRLPKETRLGRVKLQVADLARSIEFYEEVLGFRTTAGDSSLAVLSAHGDDTPIIELHELPGAKTNAVRSRLGLFHIAYLVPDRPSLGRFVKHLAAINARAGASDHVVSEAFYLQDPDNLGIEVYVDRPRSTWKRVGRQLLMGTDPIDIAGLHAAADGPWKGMPAGTTVGHVHLHVGDIATASSFYSDTLGFDRIVWNYPGALFLSAGGYHHHLGTNTWAGRAPSPAEDDARLLEWTIQLPDDTAMDAVAKSLANAGHETRRDGADLVVPDPWRTDIRFARSPARVSRLHDSAPKTVR